MAEPDVRPPGAASPSAKSISGRRNSSRSNGRSHEKFGENTSTIPEVMDSSTLNLKANFKFYDFFFFWGGGERVPPSPFGRVLVSLGQSLACVKISGRNTP